MRSGAHTICVVINYLINCIPFALPNFYSFIGLKKDIFPFQPPKICLSILLVCGVRIVLSSMGTHIFDTNNSKHRSIYMVLTYIDAQYSVVIGTIFYFSWVEDIIDDKMRTEKFNQCNFYSNFFVLARPIFLGLQVKVTQFIFDHHHNFYDQLYCP